jgi:hypothetical protein
MIHLEHFKLRSGERSAGASRLYRGQSTLYRRARGQAETQKNAITPLQFPEAG